jgi:hypothetical protein
MTIARSTSCSDALMVVVRSITSSILIACGIDASSWGRIALTRSTVSIRLAAGFRYRTTRTAGCHWKALDGRPHLLPWVHRIFSNLKVWALGVYHGLRRQHLQSFLDELMNSSSASIAGAPGTPRSDPCWAPPQHASPCLATY